ncbi:hypothetical protein F511_38356 [Dorcoceras hygrometricum]|uniref:Uncharacterized protein n=1 Tax=Dorcoceras hygrometricum TaxID=472368 RepID=A0A2Z7AYH7_9LAMI|nr:hypothetical protein F511_38356 [Dorcoceras hygrometricum]
MKIVTGARPRPAATSAALPCAIVHRRAATNQQMVSHHSRNRAQINSTIVAHRSSNVRPSPRDTCAQDFVIGRRSLAQRVEHTSSNWSASMEKEAANSRPPCASSAHVARAHACWDGHRLSGGNRHFTVGGGRLRQSGPRPEGRLLRQPALEGLTRSPRTDSPRQVGRNNFRRSKAAAAARIQLAVGPQPLWLRNHNSGLAHRIMIQQMLLAFITSSRKISAGSYSTSSPLDARWPPAGCAPAEREVAESRWWSAQDVAHAGRRVAVPCAAGCAQLLVAGRPICADGGTRWGASYAAIVERKTHGGAAGRPPLRRVSGDVVTAGLNSSRVWFGPVPGSP